MKRRNYYLMLGLALVLLSAMLYVLHYAVFKDPHHIYIYMLGDLAFLPIEVLVVSLIVDQLLNEREKRVAMEKLNMVIGAFFSEVGTELLRRLCSFDSSCGQKREALRISGEWSDRKFSEVKDSMAGYGFAAESRATDLRTLKELLVGHRDFMVRLLENPLLLEHETFSDLLWAVFHLTDELENRSSLTGLPEADMNHLSGDMSRAYALLASEWLAHMTHLKKKYPYLFSLAIRLNPFDPEASAVIR